MNELLISRQTFSKHARVRFNIGKKERKKKKEHFHPREELLSRHDSESESRLGRSILQSGGGGSQSARIRILSE